MKLAYIHYALSPRKISDEAGYESPWGNFQNLQKNHKLAFKLMEFGISLLNAYQLITEHKDSLIKGMAKKGKEICLIPGTKKYEKFVKEFSAFLDEDSGIESFGVPLGKVMGTVKRGSISESDLFIIDSLFKPNPP